MPVPLVQVLYIAPTTEVLSCCTYHTYCTIPLYASCPAPTSYGYWTPLLRPRNGKRSASSNSHGETSLATAIGERRHWELTSHNDEQAALQVKWHRKVSDSGRARQRVASLLPYGMLPTYRDVVAQMPFIIMSSQPCLPLQSHPLIMAHPLNAFDAIARSPAGYVAAVR